MKALFEEWVSGSPHFGTSFWETNLLQESDFFSWEKSPVSRALNSLAWLLVEFLALAVLRFDVWV